MRPLAASPTGTAGKGNPVEIAPSLRSENKTRASQTADRRRRASHPVQQAFASIARTHVDNKLPHKHPHLTD